MKRLGAFVACEACGRERWAPPSLKPRFCSRACYDRSKSLDGTRTGVVASTLTRYTPSTTRSSAAAPAQPTSVARLRRPRHHHLRPLAP